MTLPKRVREQVEAADALLRQTTTAEAAPPEVDLATLANAPAPAPEAAPAPAPSPAPAPVAPPAAATPVAPPPAKSLPPAPEETWEQRFRSLQGLFNQQVPALQSQVRELTDKNQETLDKLNRYLADQQAAAPAQAPQMDPKDAEVFGEDLVQMVSRVAQSTLASVARKVEEGMASFEARIQTLENGVREASTTAARSAEQAFFDRLGRLVPDWEQLNGDQGFLAWLGDSDPVYGVARQVALTNAQQALNPDRAAAVFNAYKTTLAPAPAPASSALEKQVTPKSSGSTAPLTNEKPTITQQQIVQFYDAVRKGGYVGREAEARNIEAAINQAIAEGRVR